MGKLLSKVAIPQETKTNKLCVFTIHNLHLTNLILSIDSKSESENKNYSHRGMKADARKYIPYCFLSSAARQLCSCAWPGGNRIWATSTRLLRTLQGVVPGQTCAAVCCHKLDLVSCLSLFRETGQSLKAQRRYRTVLIRTAAMAYGGT